MMSFRTLSAGRYSIVLALAPALCLSLLGCTVPAERGAEAYEPVPWQDGKDVVWVPTPTVMVGKMLDMAAVGPRDYVIDLGSGDGRNVIAAAKRGARSLGVEFNPDMVAYSRRMAAAEGVADRARFVEGDMFEADISQASVLALFLLPDNLGKLKARFAGLAPGSRIVNNGFEIPGWQAERTERSAGACDPWCTAYLYVVPARAQGTWQLGAHELRLTQDFETLSGARGNSPISSGRLKGDRIRFVAGLDEYVGRVRGDSMSGTVSGSVNGHWTAQRLR